MRNAIKNFGEAFSKTGECPLMMSIMERLATGNVWIVESATSIPAASLEEWAVQAEGLLRRAEAKDWGTV